MSDIDATNVCGSVFAALNLLNPEALELACELFDALREASPDTHIEEMRKFRTTIDGAVDLFAVAKLLLPRLAEIKSRARRWAIRTRPGHTFIGREGWFVPMNVAAGSHARIVSDPAEAHCFASANEADRFISENRLNPRILEVVPCA